MLKIFNTLGRQKEEFKAINKNQVKFYQCGPTVYSYQHIGNLRSVVLADFINRSLQYLGYEVIFVRNYTDVGHLSGDNEGDADQGEDRMAKASRTEKKDPIQIANFYIQSYEKDIKDLNTLLPTFQPRATEHIQEQIEMIKILLAKKYAYQSELAIYFDTSQLKNYHQLSGQNLSENICGAGSGEVQDGEKKNPADFALWFFKKGVHQKALQTWPSPWGEGFPGWHLECSAMAKKYLGETLDLKMGGIEHIPIHHTNEIAQSEQVNDKKYVNYWLHNEHLTMAGKKMSKSAGTVYLLTDIVKKGFSPLDLRYFFLQSHYRSKQNFTWEALKASQKAREKLILKLKQLPTGGEVSAKWNNKFKEKIADDFSMPEALAVVWEILKSDLNLADQRATILNFDLVLGLNLKEEIEKKVEIPKEIEKLAEEREQARQKKDWAESDRLRAEIKKAGFEVKDLSTGFEIFKI